MIRPAPCDSCPYRMDVPSGVWHPSEYEKLRGYDRPTMEQPVQVFACHATPELLCHGWAVVHTSRGHENDLLALRLRPAGPIPPAAVPLFASGAEAAEHGLKDVGRPSARAKKTATRLLKKHKRLRAGTPDEPLEE